MKCYQPLFARILLVASVAGVIYLVTPVTVTGQMMGGEGMKGMREMMQRMMGDVLPPGIDPAQLPAPTSKGARLLARYCMQCHNLPGPGMHTAPEWPAVVARMNRRVQMMSGHGMMMGQVEAPSADEFQSMLDYLQAHAQRPIDPTRYPILATAAGRAFQRICARCHALPDPQQHTAKEWPAVMGRMQQNMRAMGRTVPDEQTLGEIIGFLQHHARQPE
ncbi:MAG: hypothetical protein GWO16_03935 [Gammaproteobacteria bacterium]|nr:hypothetical protein [Gammaproteobacteria bacterium]NIR28854.1 hypothetical protein [Gammaproteobacteria bacterium]NIR97235.1 hypothetical protein [Gammaproteobacteria bacterium]NIT62946.1 hypothetical protein [Gammaproteobacteria bacterium]NIV20636.1 hypothetical protein [Gammaproteobacteria bacterium]